jgi:hypothetical protein
MFCSYRKSTPAFPRIIQWRPSKSLINYELNWKKYTLRITKLLSSALAKAYKVINVQLIKPQGLKLPDAFIPSKRNKILAKLRRKGKPTMPEQKR